MTKYLAAMAIMLATPGIASASQIVLSASNIVGVSSAYNQGAGDNGPAFVANGARVTGVYGAGNLFNAQIGQPAVENFTDGSYFLTGDGVSSPTVSNPFVAVDLGAAYTLSGFELFNTSNGHVQDRGTATFAIFGSNVLIDDGANGSRIGGAPTLLAVGSLMVHTHGVAPLAQSFSALSDESFRYIQFMPLTGGAHNLYQPFAMGLNELKVFGSDQNAGPGAVPEPATWAMMIGGFAMAGATLRRRRMALRFT
ncbi:hypothetical protein SLG_07220 [Sphingobium sp. SYK-6]|uniref:PEPxxWA-CTERM sorting domain-containing protein n=1 Tax=Sphingobium sp. (strain NBRC 103272 / SYK-6) TaxID=627192 RepID=UPI0002276A37|nr:PEPxxWA-CTERM sorting domain-containing protein [Sphingobium sp. SYK-6]BAK65397.1 hypothetical protein SLG_07220 [Sphingobium sp. SYK-6]